MTWTATTALPSGLSTSDRILLSVSRTTNVVYAMEINTSGTLSGVFRSADQGATWASMGQPSPTIYPGGQGIIHGAIVADPTDANVVFVAGDRQDSPFPNVNGASNFSGNVFRGVFSVTGTAWQNVVMNGNGGGANGTSPHADSRSMVFDPSGNILQGNDGGIFKLSSPNSAGSRIWSSLNSNITPTEAHSAAYDPVSNVVFSGNQDTGTSIQNTPGGAIWNDFSQGDGGIVAVDATTAAPNSIRYGRFTGLAAYRATFDPSNNFVSIAFPNYLITSGPGTGQTINQFDPNIQFYNPYVLNRVNPTRMLIGTSTIYESLNQGDTVANLGFTGASIGDGFGNSPLTYGGLNQNGSSNPGSFYVGRGSTIYHRSSDGSPIVTLGSYPGTTVRALVSDPKNVAHIFVLDTSSRVWGSLNEGATWTNLTANLGTVSNLGTGSSVRTIEIFSPSASPLNTVLIVGGQGGVWQMRRPGAAGTTWTTLATGFPHALVYDLHYDYTDNVLVAGTLGRGVWTLTNFFRGGGGTGSPGALLGPGGLALSSAASGQVFVAPAAPPVSATRIKVGLAPMSSPFARSGVDGASSQAWSVLDSQADSSTTTQPVKLVIGGPTIRHRSLLFNDRLSF